MEPQNQNVIYCHSSYGPSFGDGRDLFISSDSNKNNRYSELGSCFTHPDYSHGSNEAKSFLAGSNDFQTVEIEVYCK